MRHLLLLAVLLLPGLGLAEGRFVKGIRVSAPPPAMRFESPPPAPSPRHQWIAGYWTGRGNAHAWVAGRWTLPPAPGYAWEPARWDEASGAWTFYEGHWRAGENADANEAYQPPPPPVHEVVVEAPPPAAVEEERPSIPFTGAVWIPGYWHWEGKHHSWVAGRWSARPAGYEWDAHRWEKKPQGRWEQHPGHWNHK